MKQGIKIFSGVTLVALETAMNDYLNINPDASFQLMDSFQDSAGNYVCITFVLIP